MATNRTHIKTIGSKTLIIIVGIIVALMISINSGLMGMTDSQNEHKSISTHIKQLLAEKSTEQEDNNLPSFLKLSQDLHKLYKKVKR